MTNFLKRLANIVECLPLCFLPMLEIAMDQVPIVSSVISEVKNSTESRSIYSKDFTESPLYNPRMPWTMDTSHAGLVIAIAMQLVTHHTELEKP